MRGWRMRLEWSRFDWFQEIQLTEKEKYCWNTPKKCKLLHWVFLHFFCSFALHQCWYGQLSDGTGAQGRTRTRPSAFGTPNPPQPTLGGTHACNNSWQQNINRVSTSGRISSFNILCPTLAKARNRKVTGVGVHSPVIPMYLHIYGNNRILITENRFYQKERSLCVLTWLTSLILDGSHYNFLIALLCFWIILHRSLYLEKDIIKLNYAWVTLLNLLLQRTHSLVNVKLLDEQCLDFSLQYLDFFSSWTSARPRHSYPCPPPSWGKQRWP